MATRPQRQRHLPAWEAFKVSLKSLRNRFSRSLISMSSIFLGIVFLISSVSANFITDGLRKERVALAGTATEAEIRAQEQNEVIQRQQRLWLIVIALMLSGIGITNTMLMSVTERFREIGTMKCMGALDRFITQLFVFESVIMGCLGTLGGILTGLLVTMLWMGFQHGFAAVFRYLTPDHMTPWCGIALGLGLVLSVVGSIYPALRAARMVPADAMRVEL